MVATAYKEEEETMKPTTALPLSDSTGAGGESMTNQLTLWIDLAVVVGLSLVFALALGAFRKPIGPLSRAIPPRVTTTSNGGAVARGGAGGASDGPLMRQYLRPD